MIVRIHLLINDDITQTVFFFKVKFIDLWLKSLGLLMLFESRSSNNVNVLDLF